MKKIFLLPLFIFIQQVQAQTLFSYGNNKVSKDEFLKAYHRNSLSSDTGKTALQDYLQLYIAYKLKLQDARDLRLDTLPSLEADVQSFRHQIEKNYLYDKDEMNLLMNQALERGRKDIYIKTIYVKPIISADTLQAKKVADELSKKLVRQPATAVENLKYEDIKIIAGDMGYVTVFTLPYAIENIIYNLKPGQWSKPYAFEDGFFIFKNEKERPAAGKIKVAQILISIPSDKESDWMAAKNRADSLYKAIENGSDFGALARQFSDDRTTFFNQGELPEFGVGKYDPEFEDHAFSLNDKDSLSKPFRSAYGYHILKFIHASPVSGLSSDEYYSQINQILLQRKRVKSATDKLIADARVKTGFKDHNLNRNDVYQVTDSSLIGNKNITSGEVNIQSVLFSFNDGSEVTVSSWDQYLRNSGRVYNLQLRPTYEEMWPEFINHSVLENYQKRLEDFDQDFAQQLTEFREGNMLFELMQKKIWTRAANDSAGQQQLYKLNRSQYKWAPSADAILFFCNNENSAVRVKKELQNKKEWRMVLQENAIDVQADSGRFQIDQLPPGTEKAKPGFTPIVKNQFDGTASFIRILKVYPGNEQRSFADARGLVIEDYQKQLEDEWVNELKKKYPVVIDNKVLASLKE